VNPKAHRALRWWGKLLVVILLCLAGFASLWYGAFMIAFSSPPVKLAGIGLVLVAIPFFALAAAIVSGRLRTRRLPAE
jgi:hypothetical protein